MMDHNLSVSAETRLQIFIEEVRVAIAHYVADTGPCVKIFTVLKLLAIFSSILVQYLLKPVSGPEGKEWHQTHGRYKNVFFAIKKSAKYLLLYGLTCAS